MRALSPVLAEKLLIASQLIADNGLDATKMEDIAVATGIPKATLYYYFKSKEDILGFLFAVILDKVEEAVADGMKARGKAANRLRAVILAHLRVYEHYPAASRALQFDLGRAARLPAINARVDTAFVDPVSSLLQAGHEDGSLRRLANPRFVALAILGAVTTVGINAISADVKRPIGEIAEQVLDFVLKGVRK